MRRPSPLPFLNPEPLTTAAALRGAEGMSKIEFAVLALFLFGVFAVFAIALDTLVVLLVRRLRKRAGAKKRIGWFRWTMVGLSAVGLLCVLYGFFVEPYWPSVTRIRIVTDKLPPGARPVRIVQISDTHCDSFPRTETRLPGLIAREKPDAIVFTGDACNSPAGLPVFRRLMRALCKIAPVYAVRGNWDTGMAGVTDFYTGTDVRELSGQAARVGDTPVWIVGVPFEDERAIPGALARAPKGAFTVLLYHLPDPVKLVAEAAPDLWLAGHTHGGQVALPLYGALITLSRHGKRFEGGLYDLGKARLYVNRGIGMEGGMAPRVRFLARPEITVFEIAPKSPKEK